MSREDELEKGISDELKEKLVKMREERLRLLDELGREERFAQKVVNTQGNRRQMFMILCLCAIFLLMFSVLVSQVPTTSLDATAGLILQIVLDVVAMVCFGWAMMRLPGALRYNATWSKYKESKPYRTLISESLNKLDVLRDKLAQSKKDFSELEEELVKRYDLSEVTASSDAGAAEDPEKKEEAEEAKAE
ncbi:MAG: hypothetical protein J5757_10180 [Lachnospiraceae bacterium]|nr:hypothetical protein [Lachnospiraceae bacterium]